MQMTLTIAALALLGLSACSTTGALQSPKPDSKISGTVTRGLIQPYRVEVNLDGKAYRGEWRTGAPTADQKAGTSLPHRHHIGEVRSVLTASDGSKLDCQWQTHGDTGVGTCRAGEREYPLNLN